VPADDAGYLVALNHIGSIRMQLDDWVGAREALERLLALQIDTAEVLSNLAWVDFRLGDFQGAELAALRALEIDPDNPDLRYDVALFRVAQGKLLEAIDTYERAISQNPDAAGITRGLEGLLTLHEVYPDVNATHYALAYFARRLSRPELERDELEHYLAAAPEGGTAEFAQARLAEIAP